MNSYSQKRITSTQSKAGTDREDLSGEIQGESGESQPAEPTGDAGAHADFGSIQGDFIYRITMNLEFNSACRRKEHSQFH